MITGLFVNFTKKTVREQFIVFQNEGLQADESGPQVFYVKYPRTLTLT